MKINLNGKLKKFILSVEIEGELKIKSLALKGPVKGIVRDKIIEKLEEAGFIGVIEINGETFILPRKKS
jgi:hypothetical protein